jgi:FlaA1/EpsC-like NDP-sugar epimerase
LRVEDLLGRESVEIDLDQVSGYLCGKVVLVTGAGGSIGSELSREILRFQPARLVLLDNDETALFNLQLDLPAIGEQFETVVADIREEQRIKSIFERYRPDIVFHSAALKHVPMMELHPCEAVKNNVMGTLNLANAAAEFDCERFLLISTDKAVQPSNAMGATKRLSELLMKRYNARSRTNFGAVRFGNVLGSRGSVVPTFETQIKNGGPVLVTDPEITRYFMTINEAAQLVVQAGAYLHDGELFILDMGEPIKILELAKKMIAILGNGKPIDIQITGLRPGEKIYEELTYQYEQLSATVHPKIAAVQAHNGIPEELYSGIGMLIDFAMEEREEESRELLMDLVNNVSQDKLFKKYLERKTVELTSESVPTRSD